MNIESLKEEYLKLTKICAETDYSNKKSVRKNNSAVSKMYVIIDIISKNNSRNEIQIFSELLSISENKTNIWVAAQMLERLVVDKETERKALEIIKRIANGDDAEAMGFQSWLADYKTKSEK